MACWIFKTEPQFRPNNLTKKNSTLSSSPAMKILNSSWIHLIPRFPVSPVAAYFFQLFYMSSLLWRIRSSDRNCSVLFPAKYKTESQFRLRKTQLCLFLLILSMYKGLAFSFNVISISLHYTVPNGKIFSLKYVQFIFFLIHDLSNVSATPINEPPHFWWATLSRICVCTEPCLRLATTFLMSHPVLYMCLHWSMSTMSHHISDDPPCLVYVSALNHVSD